MSSLLERTSEESERLSDQGPGCHERGHGPFRTLGPPRPEVRVARTAVVTDVPSNTRDLTESRRPAPLTAAEERASRAGETKPTSLRLQDVALPACRVTAGPSLKPPAAGAEAVTLCKLPRGSVARGPHLTRSQWCSGLRRYHLLLFASRDDLTRLAPASKGRGDVLHTRSLTSPRVQRHPLREAVSHLGG